MEEIATVIDAFGDKVKLSFLHQEFCKKCGACQVSEDGGMSIELENTVGAKTGDKVLVKIEPSNLKVSVILYGLPSLLFIIGIFIGYFSFHSEIFAFFTGFCFLIISFFAVKLLLKKCEPKIKKMQGFDLTLVGLPKPEASHNKCSPHFSAGERSE